MLYLSSPIGLGHARRDLAIVAELRRLRPGVQVDWLAQHPVTRMLEEAGERSRVSMRMRLRRLRVSWRSILQVSVAAALTLPAAVLAMGPHLIPSLKPVLDFPGRAWVELALTTPNWRAHSLELLTRCLLAADRALGPVRWRRIVGWLRHLSPFSP